MYHLMQNLPLLGACGVVAMLVGPLACVPINLGAWLLEIVARRMSRTVVLAARAGSSSDPLPPRACSIRRRGRFRAGLCG
jgi:hypothetical protein